MVHVNVTLESGIQHFIPFIFFFLFSFFTANFKVTGKKIFFFTPNNIIILTF